MRLRHQWNKIYAQNENFHCCSSQQELETAFGKDGNVREMMDGDKRWEREKMDDGSKEKRLYNRVSKSFQSTTAHAFSTCEITESAISDSEARKISDPEKNDSIIYDRYNARTSISFVELGNTLIHSRQVIWFNKPLYFA